MRLLALAAIVLVAGSLTACEDSPPPAAEKKTSEAGAPPSPSASTDPRALRRDTFNAMVSIESAHVTGKIHDEDLGVATVEGTFGQDGTCRMTVTSRKQGSFVVLTTGGSAWFRADETFWRAYAGDATEKLLGMIGDRWVTDSSGGDLSNLADSCDLGVILEDLEGDTSDLPRISDGTSGELVISYGSADDAVDLYVDATEPHHIRRAVSGNGDNLRFDRIDEPFDVPAPSSQRVFDLASLSVKA